MKSLFNHPFIIYVFATLACLFIMVIVDYILAAEAEHLNAWVILNRLIGRDTPVGDSLAIRKLGLAGASLVMIILNALFGVILVNLLRQAISFFHT